MAKAWDAVNDPIFGNLVDKINFRKGKHLSWLRIAAIAIPLSTFLLFIVPASVRGQAKIIWSGAAYILWDMNCTLCDVPFNAAT